VIGHSQSAIGTRQASLEPSFAAGTVLALQAEVISPELVLVDPELARRERARLEEKAKLGALPPTWRYALPALVETAPGEERSDSWLNWREAARVSKKRLVPAALMCSLFVNGYLAAELLGRTGSDATPAAVGMSVPTESSVALTASPASSVPTRTAAPIRTEAPKPKVGAQKPKVRAQKLKVGAQKPKPKVKLPAASVVERRLLLSMIGSPGQGVPARFLDPRTGSVKNNVQVACRRQTSSFLCAVRLPSSTQNGVVYVRYSQTRNGNGVFHWRRKARD
jgi:hypothetical protein